MKATSTDHPKVSDPSYKKGQEVSLRVYTIEDESRYILVKNVPKLGLIHELQDKVTQMVGEENAVVEAKYLDNPEIFSESDKSSFYHLQDAILLKFNSVMNALLAKKRCNHLSFYGLLLHVQYAPQFETLDDTREKYLFRIQRVD